MTTERLLNQFWQVVADIVPTGFDVRCCVFHGASINRKFYNTYADDYADDFITYNTINSFAISP